MTTFSLAAGDLLSLQEEECPMVEVPPPPVTASWQKSSASGSPPTECVEMTRTHSHVWVRDSKNPLKPVLGLTGQAWTAFLGAVQRDEFTKLDLPA